MKKAFKKIEGTDLENILNKIKNNSDFQLILNELTKNKTINSKEFLVLNSEKYESSDLNLLLLVLRLTDDKVRIIISISDLQINFSFRILETANGDKIAKTFTVSGNKEEVIANLPCLHGNWCGGL